MFLEGSCSISPAYTTPTTAEEEFDLNYTAEYGVSSSQMFGEGAYDAVVLATLATYKANMNGDSITSGSGGVHLREISSPPGEEITPGNLARAIQLLKSGDSIDYTGASGDLDFDIKGDVAVPLEYTCFQNGQLVVVESLDIKSVRELLQQMGDSKVENPPDLLPEDSMP